MIEETIKIHRVFLAGALGISCEFLVINCGIFVLFQMLVGQERFLAAWEITKELFAVVFEKMILECSLFMELSVTAFDCADKGEILVMSL